MKCGTCFHALCSVALYLLSSLPVTAGDLSPERLAGSYDYCPSIGCSRSYGVDVSINPNGTLRVKRGSLPEIGELKDGRLVLETGRTVTTHEGKPVTVATRYYPVQWGERLYLVPEQDAEGFVNAVNSGVEPTRRSWGGRYYLKTGDEDKKVSGDPNIPGSYKKLLLSKSVEGKVTAFTVEGKAWIDVGSDDEILPGMWLLGHMSPDKFARYGRIPGLREGVFPVQVSTVEGNRCLITGGFYLDIGGAVTSRHWD